MNYVSRSGLHRLWLSAWVLSAASPAAAIPAEEQNFAVHGQFTYVEQQTSEFNAPYSGPNSLSPNRAAETTDATLYLGARLWSGAEGWINGEIDQGFGLDNTLGVAGFPSGEAYKVGKNQPYLRMPRLFIRQTLNLDDTRRTIEASANQLGGARSADRLVITAGAWAAQSVPMLKAVAQPERQVMIWTQPRRPELFGSCGFPIASCSVSLRDDDNNEVAPGEAGEICVRAPHAMEKYRKRPEQTAETFKGGWLHTGDVARADERGYLYIVDRKKDMIISGGENIFPNDVEEILYRHPAVEMAAVVGAPDPKWGEIVVAAVKLKPGSSVDEGELIAHCKTFLSSFKVPKKIDFRDQMPMSFFGKILRRDVRKSYWEHLEVKV
jgi:acyl-CoA synthetase (AMP-forming)/AMP-acid ligase II